MSPDGAGAAEDSEPLAGPVLLATQGLAGDQLGAVQLGGAAQLHKVRVTVGGEPRPRARPCVTPLSRPLGANSHGPELEVCREEEGGQRAVTGLVIIPQGEQPHHLRHQNVASCGHESVCLLSHLLWILLSGLG